MSPGLFMTSSPGMDFRPRRGHSVPPTKVSTRLCRTDCVTSAFGLGALYILSWFSVILSYLQKSEKIMLSFDIRDTIFLTKLYCNRTVIKFKFCCNSMISQPLPNFKTQFSQKYEVGSYDNIALNQL